jgi:cell division septation protein DedD
MRKFILITTMVLASASAQAGSRGLTLASNEEPAAAASAQAVDTKPVDTKPVDVKPVDAKPAEAKPAEVLPAETPKYVDRPAAVGSKPQQSADQCPCTGSAGIDAPKTVKPKRRHESTEARVIYELHRHGIYW